uniref:Uncharacterized protein n=1 Tax=Caenorhabditis japonica TaxID=281687 RepID=A0A8R1EJK8_CAEJA
MEHLEEKEDDHEDVMESVESGSNSSLGGPMEATWARMAEDRQTRSAVVAPLRKFGEELRGRWLELGGEVWMKSVMNIMRALKVENADDLETSFIELRNVDDSVEQLKNENELLKEEFSNSESMWTKEKESLKRTVRDLSKNAEKWRCRAEDAEKAIKVAKRGHVVNESGDESQASEDYLSMRERLRRRSSRRDMSTDSARRSSGQEARQEKKKCSGASKWDKNSARSQKSTAETVKEVVASMNKMMRVAALPEPKAFDGSGSFREFKRTFLMKFRDVVEDDEDLMAILEDTFLLGSAKSLFRSLESRRNRTIKVLFDEFEEKLKRRQ